ncbi:unnamed protein product [Spirodela intermedia]|uniref:Protein kinase domain-containing protein n=1 Tax=Spirodela intermedia TaxID=51605 RepID=A0A7I8J880_SPIIN|nr:unnamed protein product [Spirodela intermedia]CAA6666426.1 unnamed protein product [Spirodela intermedia]
MYTYEKLSTATRCFSSANLLGKGGFGSVYRGNFSNPPSVVAVKRISATSKQGEREYFAEICTIGRLHHKNIVQLQGWCHSGKSLLLVYEFMPNGSLDRHITAGTLDWPTRHRILLGLASALLYLHEECGGTVVHRDVKPNNVLLDADFEAHLGDFGLARLAREQTGPPPPPSSPAPSGHPESDVFSYGVVVLEVVCGRRSLMGLDDNNLLDHVWELYTSGKLLQAVDPRLESQFDEEEVRRTLLVGLMCSHPNPASRPRSRQVVQILGNPSEPLMEMPESRPDTIIPSPSMMDFSFEIVSIMSTSTTMPMGASPDSTKSMYYVLPLFDRTIVLYSSGEREYFAEICTIGRLRHKNIVQLQGCLDRHITAGTLDWPTRHRILLGLASALLYLHEECGGTVVHRDVKPNNVLLDADFEAHLGDFGLARLAQGTDRTTSTTVLAGTIGYLAPEYGYTGKATPESDIFSYGVVVLEVVCGRMSLLGWDDNNLLDHVWDLYISGKLLQAVDSRLECQFDEEVRRTLLVGLMCSHTNPASRPRSRQVVQILGNPNQPLLVMPESRPDIIIPSSSRTETGFTYGGVAVQL